MLLAPALRITAAVATNLFLLLVVQITAWAESHLTVVSFMNSTEPTHSSAQEVQWLDQQCTTLLEKNLMRKG